MTIEKYYDIKKSKRVELPFMTNREALQRYKKGWGYSFVYSLVEVRDIYLTLKRHGITSISQFTDNYVINKVPYIKKQWNKRRVLEVLNALINFDMIDSDYHALNKDDFYNSSIGEPLSTNDKAIFREIFFTYFRFKELLLLYINPDLLSVRDKNNLQNITEQDIISNSSMLFNFIEEGNYVDSFFKQLEDNPIIYTIPELNDDGDKNGGVKRFWDVFMKWGDDLGIMEKFNMNSIGCKLSNNKSFVCSYILSNRGITTSLPQYIENKFSDKRTIDLSQLIFELCIDFRVSCDDAKNYIIEEYKKNAELISLVRTSEVFIKRTDIKEGEKIFYPKYKDSYISNIILRQ
jgi:hypothetical protein